MEKPTKLCIQLIGAHYCLVHPSEILCVEANRQVCHFTLADGSRLTASRHLGFYKNGLIKISNFVEVSRSMLVNMSHVAKYATRERIIYLSNGLIIPVSMSRQEEINQLFKKLHEVWIPESE